MGKKHICIECGESCNCDCVDPRRVETYRDCNHECENDKQDIASKIRKLSMDFSYLEILFDENNWRDGFIWIGKEQIPLREAKGEVYALIAENARLKVRICAALREVENYLWRCDWFSHIRPLEIEKAKLFMGDEEGKEES